MGTYFFSSNNLEEASEHNITINKCTKEHRELFTNFNVANGCEIMNTYFNNPCNKTVSMRSIGAQSFKAPWSDSKYDTVDYVVVADRW